MGSNYFHSFRQGMGDWSSSVEEIYKLIGLLLCRGIIGKGFPLKQLWNRQWAPSLYSRGMIRDRFLSLLKFIRFDDEATRQSRLRDDKVASQISGRFIENILKYFNSGPS